MRTVKFDGEVGDVPGLFFDLIQRGFELLSISVHERSTYINLEDEEDKNPLAFVGDFLEKPATAPSRSTMEERREVYRKFLEEKPLRMQNLRARFRVSQEVQAIAREVTTNDVREQPVALLEEKPVEILTMTPPKPKGLLQRIKDGLDRIF